MKTINVKVTDLKIVSEKHGNDLESMKAYNIKITDDINTLKKDIDKQFVKVTEQIADVRCIMAVSYTHLTLPTIYSV